MKGLFVLLIIASSGMFATCSKERINCKQTIYAFEGHFKAWPDNEILHIDDTIWLELVLPTRLVNQENNQTVSYTGAQNLGIGISFLELKGQDPLHTPVPAANSFDHVLQKGTTIQPIDPTRHREYLCREENEQYLLKVGIVPKKKGLFSFTPSDAVNVHTGSNKCDKANFNLSFANTNQHLYLYEQNRPGYTPSQYEREHMYCFKVE